LNVTPRPATGPVRGGQSCERLTAGQGAKAAFRGGQLIDTLVLREYLERRNDPEDRRRMGVRLTERGRTAAIAIQTATDAIDASLVHLITADELHGLRAGLAAYKVIRDRSGD
jgi:hypothetical protein